MNEISKGVTCLPLSIVNAYFVGEPGEPWTLVDAGMPGQAGEIRDAAERRYGAGATPSAVVLTHGHFDHVGALPELLKVWDVPVYAHALEWPYLTGRSAYPPFDPTVGGFFPALSRFFPEKPYDFGGNLRELPADGTVPTMPGWQWLETPGHSPGHVSLFRPADGTLIAGDAFITMNMDSFWGSVTKAPVVYRPPTYATCDWQQAAHSVQSLAALRPQILAAGHGVPMSGPDVADQLAAFAEVFPIPSHGRYVPDPARADETGVVAVPPPVPDLGPVRLALGLGTAALVTWAVSAWRRRT